MLLSPSRRPASLARPPAVLVLPPGRALAFSGGRGEYVEGWEVEGNWEGEGQELVEGGEVGGRKVS